MLYYPLLKYCAVLSKNPLKSLLHLPDETEFFVVFLKHEMRFLLDFWLVLLILSIWITHQRLWYLGRNCLRTVKNTSTFTRDHTTVLSEDRYQPGTFLAFQNFHSISRFPKDERHQTRGLRSQLFQSYRAAVLPRRQEPHWLLTEWYLSHHC